jgi:hypothetical protein
MTAISKPMPQIGDRVSVKSTSFVFGIIESIGSDGSVQIRVDDSVRAVPNEDACFPEAFWIEKEED